MLCDENKEAWEDTVMNQYYNAGAGLKKMFIGQVGAIVCTILAIIPFVGIIGGTGALVFAVVSLVGLYGAGKDIAGCRTAIFLQMLAFVLSVFSMFFAGNWPMLVLFNTADSILSFLIVYFVCNSVSDVMLAVGADDTAKKGRTVWRVNLLCYIATIVILLFSFVPIVNVIAAVASLAVMIVSVVAAIMFMLFLNKSYLDLGA